MPISESKLSANQANARRSTGPRSEAGKAASAQNARRHGLSRPTALDPVERAEAEALAEALAEARPERQAAAWAFAELELQLRRIYRLADQLLAIEVAGLRTRSEFASLDELEAEAAARSADRLRKLNDYERRLASRRAKAARALAASVRR
jgi:hypothetical protein